MARLSNPRHLTICRPLLALSRFRWLSRFSNFVGISKTYPGVIALQDVSSSVEPGEVIGLVGENGAGKCTLMRILGGVAEPTLGAIRIDGDTRSTFSVPDALKAGIAFVHQELNLFDNLSQSQANVFIGREPLKGGVSFKLIDRRRSCTGPGSSPLLAAPRGRLRATTRPSLNAVAQRRRQTARDRAGRSRFEARLHHHGRAHLQPDHHRDGERLMRVIAELPGARRSASSTSPHRLSEVGDLPPISVVVLRDGRSRRRAANGTKIRARAR